MLEMDLKKSFKKARESLASLGFVFVGVLFSSTLFYLTPLKHINIILPDIKKIAPQEFYDSYTTKPDQYVMVDIRSPEFRALEYPEMSVSIPLNTLIGQIDSLPKNKSIIIFCESNFSASAAYHVFQNYGFLDVHIIDGGRTAWREASLPLVPGEQEKVKIAKEIIRLKKELGAAPG